ncbi:ATPase component of ABC transporters with duplicated ATPase domains [Bacteroidales bacterium 6E]|nr:ATPase component of ABC transporters with duplicated ATPase domains [Bacteroidales bacterium 6E]
MISVDKVSLNFGGFELFREISFLVGARDRIGLTGKNGAGKTTLLKMMSGQLSPSAGRVSMPKDVTIGYLPQQMILSDSRNVIEETRLAFKPLLDMQERIAELSHLLAVREDYHSDEYLKLIEEHHELGERLRLLGGDNYEAAMEQTLAGLGFERSDFQRMTSEFSGGWRMRIELAKLLLKNPDVFLLDEPTNHLDIESIQWLEDFLKNYRGAVVLVSHDKAFLDNITNRTIEISLAKISDQRMNYTAFQVWKQEQREQQLAAFRNQQKLIDDTEKFIERFRYKASKAVQVQSRVKALDRLDRLEVEEEDNSAVRLRFPPSPRSGNVVVEARGVTKDYGSLRVLDDIDLTVMKGERIAFVGRNGEGKTTLARIIMNEITYDGEMKLGHNVKIGYFAQNQEQLLDNNLTVLETIDQIAVGDVRTRIRDILGAFLFSGEEVDKKVSVLSGGERTRLAMIRLLLEPVNFLVLDEPTNHLDMRTKDILKQALADYDGTVLLVSHDREFLDGLVTCVYEFRNKKLRQHLGGIYDFLQDKKMESLKELEARQTTRTADREMMKAAPDPVQEELSFEERKNINKNITRLEKSVAAAEEDITRLEKKISEMDALLANPDKINHDDFFGDYENVKKELADTMESWERLHNELEEWNTKKSW